MPLWLLYGRLGTLCLFGSASGGMVAPGELVGEIPRFFALLNQVAVLMLFSNPDEGASLGSSKFVYLPRPSGWGGS